jgi:hypothetical protein
MAGSKMPRTSPKSSSDYPTPDQEILMAELQQIPYAWACYAEDGSILQYANIFAVFPTRKLALEECRENKNAYKPVKVKIVPHRADTPLPAQSQMSPPTMETVSLREHANRRRQLLRQRLRLG